MQVQARDISSMALASVKQAFLLNLRAQTDAKAPTFTNDDLVQTLSDPKVTKLSICLAQYSQQPPRAMSAREICNLDTRNLQYLWLFAQPGRNLLPLVLKHRVSQA